MSWGAGGAAGGGGGTAAVAHAARLHSRPPSRAAWCGRSATHGFTWADLDRLGEAASQAGGERTLAAYQAAVARVARSA